MNDRLSDNSIEAVDAYVKKSLNAWHPGEAQFIRKWIWEGLFKISSFEIALRGKEKLSESEILKVHFAVKDILNGRPVQYVVGEVPFLNVVLKVNENVLIPRPETEEMVSRLFQKVKEGPLSVLDLGTGSGCMAIAMSKQWPLANVEGWDISERALDTGNESNLLNDTHVLFQKRNILDLHDESSEWDIMVSNPPYIPMAESKEMDLGVVQYEPHLALFVPDEDPLIFYRAIQKFALRTLKQKGWMALEVHPRYAQDVAALWREEQGWLISVETDLQEKERFVFAHRKG